MDRKPRNRYGMYTLSMFLRSFFQVISFFSSIFFPCMYAVAKRNIEKQTVAPRYVMESNKPFPV